jgi:hypothetical protein
VTEGSIQKALQMLRPDSRAVVTLRLVEGYSVQETADIFETAERHCGFPPSTGTATTQKNTRPMAINENERQLAWLYRAFDEGLSPEEQQQLEAALAASESLRAEQQRLQVLRQSLSSLQPEASEAFTDAVMARLNADRANVIPLRWLVQVAAACVLIILLAGLSIYTTEGSLSNRLVRRVMNERKRSKFCAERGKKRRRCHSISVPLFESKSGINEVQCKICRL